MFAIKWGIFIQKAINWNLKLLVSFLCIVQLITILIAIFKRYIIAALFLCRVPVNGLTVMRVNDAIVCNILVKYRIFF